jgi:hypothetical protein
LAEDDGQSQSAVDILVLAAIAAIRGETGDCALPRGGESLGITGICFDGSEEGPGLPLIRSVAVDLNALDGPLDFPPRFG